MSPATWRRVKALYADACDLPETERENFVDQQAAFDPRAAAETIRPRPPATRTGRGP